MESIQNNRLLPVQGLIDPLVQMDNEIQQKR
jgi:hypothetical protein